MQLFMLNVFVRIKKSKIKKKKNKNLNLKHKAKFNYIHRFIKNTFLVFFVFLFFERLVLFYKLKAATKNYKGKNEKLIFS